MAEEQNRTEQYMLSSGVCPSATSKYFIKKDKWIKLDPALGKNSDISQECIQNLPISKSPVTV